MRARPRDTFVGCASSVTRYPVVTKTLWAKKRWCFEMTGRASFLCAHGAKREFAVKTPPQDATLLPSVGTRSVAPRSQSNSVLCQAIAGHTNEKLQESNLAPKVGGQNEKTSTSEWPLTEQAAPVKKECFGLWPQAASKDTAKGQHCRSKCASSQGRVGYGRWSGTQYRRREQKTRRITGRSRTRQTNGQLCERSSKER